MASCACRSPFPRRARPRRLRAGRCVSRVRRGRPSTLPFVSARCPQPRRASTSRVLTAGEAFDATTHPAPESGGPPEPLGEVSSVRIFATSSLCRDAAAVSRVALQVSVGLRGAGHERERPGPRAPRRSVSGEGRGAGERGRHGPGRCEAFARILHDGPRAAPLAPQLRRLLRVVAGLGTRRRRHDGLRAFPPRHVRRSPSSCAGWMPAARPGGFGQDTVTRLVARGSPHVRGGPARGPRHRTEGRHERRDGAGVPGRLGPRARLVPRPGLCAPRPEGAGSGDAGLPSRDEGPPPESRPAAQADPGPPRWRGSRELSPWQPMRSPRTAQSREIRRTSPGVSSARSAASTTARRSRPRRSSRTPGGSSSASSRAAPPAIREDRLGSPGGCPASELRVLQNGREVPSEHVVRRTGLFGTEVRVAGAAQPGASSWWRATTGGPRSAR